MDGRLARMETGDPLVTPEWLLQNIDAPDIRVVDATWTPPFLTGRTSGKDSYKEAHIIGAAFFDINHIAAPNTDLPHMLPDAVLFSSRVRKLGLGDGHRIIIYDANGIFAAARVWWMFRAMGHKDVFVLNGTLEHWQAIGGEVEDLPPVPVERHYTARRRADLVRDKAQMQSITANGNTPVLDARSTSRFDGSAPEPRADLKSGHMPNSYCVPASSLMNSDGTLKSANDLAPILQDYLGHPVITTCGSGVSAAIIALALARLGNWDVAVYDGSWCEWASDPECAIVTA